MKKWWGIMYVGTMLFWLFWGIVGIYHIIVRNQIDANLVLVIVGFGITVNTLLNESRSRGIEKQIEGLSLKIDGLNQSINQRISDHLRGHT